MDYVDIPHIDFPEDRVSDEKWRCVDCTFDNPPYFLVCDVCGSERHPSDNSEGFIGSSDHALPSNSFHSGHNLPPVLKARQIFVPLTKAEAEGWPTSEVSEPNITPPEKGKKKNTDVQSGGIDWNSTQERSSGGSKGLKEDLAKKLTLVEQEESSKKYTQSLDSYKPEPWMVDAVQGNEKETLHLIVVGHVDAGKSTLMGHLLHRLGNVSKKEMHRNEKEAKEKGKGSFAFAWVLDEGAEERARGVTMSVAMTHLETQRFHVVLLDAPGHRDFVPSLISGASQADAAILAIDATPGAFEAGMEGEKGRGGGQTREHAQLARSLGVEQLIVAINKMDVVDYSEAVYNLIKKELGPFLKHCGFRDSKVMWLPVSGLEGQNLMEASTNENLKSWYTGPTLMEAIDSMQSPSKAIERPLRLPIAEVLKSRTLGQAAVSGKLEGGGLKPGMKVIILPSGDLATVKVLEREGTAVSVALAGEQADVGLHGIDAVSLFSGAVLCHPDFPVPVVKRFEARILTLGIMMPIVRGTEVVLHAHCAQESASVVELVALLDSRSGAVTRKRVRVVTANQSALVEIAVDRGICLEEYSHYRALGRVTLRDRGRTLAVGIVTRILL